MLDGLRFRTGMFLKQPSCDGSPKSTVMALGRPSPGTDFVWPSYLAGGITATLFMLDGLQFPTGMFLKQPSCDGSPKCTVMALGRRQLWHLWRSGEIR